MCAGDFVDVVTDDRSGDFLLTLFQMFEDVQQLQELRALTFAMPHGKMRASKARAEAPSASSGGSGARGGFDRPWASDQGKGYIDYDNHLWWDHGCVRSMPDPQNCGK